MAIEVQVNDDGCDADSLVYCGAVVVTVAAEASWAEFVDLAVAREWVGIERLGGLAATVGEAVAGNVAAYGQAVADTIWAVATIDRQDGARRRFAMVDCEFGEGGSRFSRATLPDGNERYEIVEAQFQFRQGALTDQVEDPDLLRTLGITPGARATLVAVRDAVAGVSA